MLKNREIAARVTEMVIDGKLSRREAAELLEGTVRTIHSYVKRYLDQGPEGLLDHRRGHHRKLSSENEEQIIACKTQRPHRSARWIRDWLKLPVSVETVRQTLMKHDLTHAKTNGLSHVIDITAGRKNRHRHDRHPEAYRRA